MNTNTAAALIANRIAREVADLMRAEVIPADVTSFADLHDFVDANELGDLCDETEPTTDANGHTVVGPNPLHSVPVRIYLDREATALAAAEGDDEVTDEHRVEVEVALINAAQTMVSEWLAEGRITPAHAEVAAVDVAPGSTVVIPQTNASSHVIPLCVTHPGTRRTVRTVEVWDAPARSRRSATVVFTFDDGTLYSCAPQHLVSVVAA